MAFSDIFKINQIKKENELLKQQNEQMLKDNQQMFADNSVMYKNNQLMHQQMEQLGFPDYNRMQQLIQELDVQRKEKQTVLDEITAQVTAVQEQYAKASQSLETQKNKLNKTKELYRAVDYAVKNYPEDVAVGLLSEENKAEFDELAPTVTLKLNCMNLKDLRKAYRENDKQINKILTTYSKRYTTKANQAIYKLMVIALRAELQNVLSNLKYEKLDKAVEQMKDVTSKYLTIAGEGNQSIAGTLTKFIGEVEYLFINAVKIEYNYYVKKEQAKQEQQAIREQMRQEAEERKALEAERKKIEKEEIKYNAEIDKLKEQLQAASDAELEKLNARILELQAQLSDVTVKKEEISNLANGKAGNVYIISNLGSFGENVFKVGMTRRLNPQDRVNELGDASVPFKFDVHSFIFSDDAVGLESKLHHILNDKRVNKVNLRKEFFYTTVDELEQLVLEIDPTAEFNKTMLAEEFRQSQSTNGVYTLSEEDDGEDDFDDEE